VTRLKDAKIETFQLDAPPDRQRQGIQRGSEGSCQPHLLAVVAVTKDVITPCASANTQHQKIKRVVQGIVDQVLNEETSLIGLTAIRDYDEYTFTHRQRLHLLDRARRRLGMNKHQLYSWASRLIARHRKVARPAHLLQKTGELTDEEWKWMAAIRGSCSGAVSVPQATGRALLSRDDVFRNTYEARPDGYPKSIRPRQVSCSARSSRSPMATTLPREAAFTNGSARSIGGSRGDARQSASRPRSGAGKAFINLLGIYPVGTLVVLDTFELAVVSAANPNPEALSRPIVKIISDAQGTESLRPYR